MECLPLTHIDLPVETSNSCCRKQLITSYMFLYFIFNYPFDQPPFFDGEFGTVGKPIVFSIVDTKISHKRCFYAPWIHHPIHHIHENVILEKQIYIYIILEIYIITENIIVFLPIFSRHLAILKISLHNEFLLATFLKSLSWRFVRRPNKRPSQVIPSLLCWSNIQNGAVPSSPSRSPIMPSFRMGKSPMFFPQLYGRFETSKPLQHFHGGFLGYENLRAFGGLVTLHEMVLFSKC